ncbi:MAG: zinc ribbon domain-containing protein [Candidatus Pacearchaeota archaeon]
MSEIGTHSFKCDNCDFVNEYTLNYEKPPEVCPKCNIGKLEKQFSPPTAFDLIGPGFYINDYGKKAWKKNLSVSDSAKVLLGEKDPY